MSQDHATALQPGQQEQNSVSKKIKKFSRSDETAKPAQIQEAHKPQAQET